MAANTAWGIVSAGVDARRRIGDRGVFEGAYIHSESKGIDVMLVGAGRRRGGSGGWGLWGEGCGTTGGASVMVAIGGVCGGSVCNCI